MTPFLWERYAPGGQLGDTYRAAGGALQALRRGAHSEPGTEPGMWPYYTRLTSEGYLTAALRAEHICLVTYGFHQQGAQFSAHQPGRGFGDALYALRASGAHSEAAIDGHVLQLASASQTVELTHHLRTIIGLMRSTKKPIGFDYTALFHDLVALQNESRAGRVRRRWGAAYHRHDDKNTNEEE